MSTRSRSPSVFRPAKGVDQSALEENEALVADINRRNVLRGALSLGALSFLTGCDVSDTSAVRSMLLAVSAWNDRVQEFMFRPNHLAPTFSEAQVRKPPRFNAYYPLEDVRPVDATSWRLELAGHIADKRPWRAVQFDELPQQELIVRHICVEGWDYIGQWSGVSLRTFLERIGADLTAKYIAFRCADDYTESLDMPTALHPRNDELSWSLQLSRIGRSNQRIALGGQCPQLEEGDIARLVRAPLLTPQRTAARPKSCTAQVLTLSPTSGMLRASRMVVT